MRTFSLLCGLLLTACTVSVAPAPTTTPVPVSNKTTSICPPWPIAGPKVAAELDMHCPKGACPATDEWLGRLYKLQAELKACRA